MKVCTQWIRKTSTLLATINYYLTTINPHSPVPTVPTAENLRRARQAVEAFYRVVVAGAVAWPLLAGAGGSAHTIHPCIHTYALTYN